MLRVTAFSVLFFVIAIADDQCCVHTIGFWKNHPEDWTDWHNRTIGCCYSPESVCAERTWFDILQYKRTTVDSDGEWRWIKLARQFIAARLGEEVLSPNGTCIIEAELTEDTTEILSVCEVASINQTRANELQEYWDSFNNAQVNGTSKDCPTRNDCVMRRCVNIHLFACHGHICLHACDAWPTLVPFLNISQHNCTCVTQCEDAHICCDHYSFPSGPQTIVVRENP